MLIILLAAVFSAGCLDRRGQAGNRQAELVTVFGEHYRPADLAAFTGRETRFTSVSQATAAIDRFIDYLVIDRAVSELNTGSENPVVYTEAIWRLAGLHGISRGVADDDVQRRYEANIGSYVRPTQIDVAFIHVLPGMSVEQMRATANAVRTRATMQSRLSGFSDLLRSEEAGWRGGEIHGMQCPPALTKNLPEMVADVACRLRPLAYSQAIETPEGIFVVRSLSRAPSRVRTLDQVREQIREEIEQERFDTARRMVVESLRSAAGPEINDAVVAAMVSPQPPDAGFPRQGRGGPPPPPGMPREIR